ncbi:MAG: hypothetical protein J7L14_01255 [Candidatus Diapherotrites archaeon]|nr:hypothetical protein [Candidatus Diapherotrites archaeon]
MNSRGFIWIILLIFVLIAIAVPVVMHLFKPADIILRIILIFVIFTTVRSYLGNGILSLIVSAILIYYLVFKWWFVFAPLYVLYILLGLQFLSVIIWGTFRLAGGQ